MEPGLITAEQLTMRFSPERAVLSDISFSIPRGEFVSILGPSGCGKSTLLRMVAGLVAPTSGRLTVDNQPPEKARQSQRTAFVFQDPTLLPWRTVTDNIRLPLELRRLPREQHQQPVAESLERIGLTAADAGKFPRMLSGGMRMRVSLARALVTDPQIMLLDEPFAALDDIMRQRLNEDLQRLWSEKRWTGLFVTHNVSEAVFLSRRILVLSAAPAQIVADVAVPFGYPREPDLRAEPEFARLTGEIGRQLRKGAA